MNDTLQLAEITVKANEPQNVWLLATVFFILLICVLLARSADSKLDYRNDGRWL